MDIENLDTTEIVDNTAVAESVSEKIPYETIKQFLVKPLDPIMVKKEFSKPVEKTTSKDENGIEATDYDEVETEVKEVESNYRKGVVIKVPLDYQKMMADEKYPATPIHVGDTVVYQANMARWFDIFKDSQLVESYSIIALVK